MNGAESLVRTLVNKWYGRSNWLNGNDISCAAISSPRWLHATLCPRSLKTAQALGLEVPPDATYYPSTRRRRTVTGPGPGPGLFSAGFSAGLWRRRSTMAPLDSQLAATILQTESSRRSTTTDEKCHPRPHHRSAA